MMTARFEAKEEPASFAAIFSFKNENMRVMRWRLTPVSSFALLSVVN